MVRTRMAVLPLLLLAAFAFCVTSFIAPCGMTSSLHSSAVAESSQPDFASSGRSERLQASRRLRPRSIVTRGAAVAEEAPPEVVDAKVQIMEAEQEARKTQETATQEEMNLFQMLWVRLSETVEDIDERFALNLSQAGNGTMMKVVLLIMLPFFVKNALQALGFEEVTAGIYTMTTVWVSVATWSSAAFFRAFTQQPKMNEKE